MILKTAAWLIGHTIHEVRSGFAAGVAGKDVPSAHPEPQPPVETKEQRRIRQEAEGAAAVKSRYPLSPPNDT